MAASSYGLDNDAIEITIAILTRNRPATALSCLEAILAQQGPGVSVLVLVNGSSDDSAEIISKTYDQVRVEVSEVNLGCPGGRNRLARLARTEWVAFIDDDGVVAPDFVARLRANIAAHPAAAVIAGCAVDALHPDPIGLTAGPVGAFSGGICALRASVFLALGGYHEDGYRQGEETELAIRLLDQGHLIWRDPELTLLHDVDLSLVKRREIVRTGLRQSVLTGVKFCPLYALVPWIVWKLVAFTRSALSVRDLRPVLLGLADVPAHVGTAWSTRAPVDLSVLLQASGRAIPARAGGRWLPASPQEGTSRDCTMIRPPRDEERVSR